MTSILPQVEELSKAKSTNAIDLSAVFIVPIIYTLLGILNLFSLPAK